MDLCKTLKLCFALCVPVLATVALLVFVHPSRVEPAGHVQWAAGLDEGTADLDGFEGHGSDSTRPRVEAYFLSESYHSGGSAALVILDTARQITLQLFRSGAEAEWTAANDELFGAPVTPVRLIGRVHGKRTVHLQLGPWPSGVYYARLTAPHGRVGYATFVLSPRHYGEHAVAIVLPTQTWQAYNYRDDDGNGVPNTWYGGGGRTARLYRPITHRGVPHHYKYYTAPFLRWALRTHHDADYLSDGDLNAISSGRELRHAYQLVIFEGHHEYVTEHEYDVVTSYRDLGGNLAFLAANNFFRRINVHDGVMTLIGQWRDLGRPEARLIGEQYYKNDNGKHRGPWIVQQTAARVPWLLENTNLITGSRFSSGGVEADRVSPFSPRNVTVIAKIENLYGDGLDADMTYYETRAGAKVFAAGAFSIACSVSQPQGAQLMANLWDHLSQE